MKCAINPVHANNKIYFLKGSPKLSIYCMLSESYLAFADINASSQGVGAKFCLLSVILLDIRSSFSEDRYMEEALLRLTFLE